MTHRKPGRLTALANSQLGIILFSLTSVGLVVAPFGRRRVSRAVRAGGAVLLAAGSLLGFRSLAELEGDYSRRVLVKPGQRLVTSGPYGRVRHPLYTATFVMYLGAALLFGSVLGLIALALFIVPRFLLVAAYEDELLAEEFGEEYESWAGRTGRFWPNTRSS